MKVKDLVGALGKMGQETEIMVTLVFPGEEVDELEFTADEVKFEAEEDLVGGDEPACIIKIVVPDDEEEDE